MKGELGLRGVHREHGEVVDDEQLGADVATQDAFERAVKLGAVQFVEHAWSRHDDDATGGLARLVGERSREKRFSRPGSADEQRIDALLEEGQIMEGLGGGDPRGGRQSDGRDDERALGRVTANIFERTPGPENLPRADRAGRRDRRGGRS